MFKSANNDTFGAKTREVLATFALMWFYMLVIISLFKLTGFVKVDLANNAPFLGACLNYWFGSNHLTLADALNSPVGVVTVLGIIIVAPFLVEEFLFRGTPWFITKDENGALKKGGWLIIVAGSFVLFGLAHRHGIFSLMVQGVSGLLLARLWFRNGPDSVASYWSTATAHSLFNISLLLVAWLG